MKEKINFKRWAELMNQVYGHNGKWAILFTIMCHFDYKNRPFTPLFFKGGPYCGKSQLAQSIRSVFSDRSPVCNLTTGADWHLAKILRESPFTTIILDEYLNDAISPAKFEMLKRYCDETPSVPLIICGQELPLQDDRILISRFIICEFSKHFASCTREELSFFEELKDIEKSEGALVGVSDEIKALASAIQSYVQMFYKEHYDVLNKHLPFEMNDKLDSLLKTISYFLATCKIVETSSNTYDEFLQIAIEKIRYQSELMKGGPQ